MSNPTLPDNFLFFAQPDPPQDGLEARALTHGIEHRVDDRLHGRPDFAGRRGLLDSVERLSGVANTEHSERAIGIRHPGALWSLQ